MIMDRTVMADLYFSTAGDSCGASNSSIVGAWPIALLGIASILNSLGCFSMPIDQAAYQSLFGTSPDRGILR